MGVPLDRSMACQRKAAGLPARPAFTTRLRSDGFVLGSDDDVLVDALGLHSYLAYYGDSGGG